jgi:broad specificity phosphatase PhoE
MATLFHLVRHGAYSLLDQALGGRNPYKLSDEGHIQAGRIAAALSGRPIAATLSSPVQRAMETAEPIAAGLGLTLHIAPDFAEIDFAGWTGAAFTSLHDDPAWHAWNVFRSTAQVPGGEAILGVQTRAVGGLMRIAAAYPDAEVVIVSHADVIKAVLAHFLGAPLDLMRRMEVSPGSISRLLLYAADAKVLAMNLPP